jgi:hypothetical protein
MKKNIENKGKRRGRIKKKRGKEGILVKNKRDALNFFFGGSSKSSIFEQPL